MTTSLLPPKSAAIAARFEPTLARQTSLGNWPCLIVSPSSEHQQLFSQAATARGWKAIITSDPHEALKLMCRSSFKLVVIDLQDADQLTRAAQLDNYRSLAEYIRWLGGVLLIVNGPVEDQPIQAESTEFWARQLGVWSYLPGILPRSDLSDLCEQAHQVVERLHHPSRSS
jgi:hypothetical protein